MSEENFATRLNVFLKFKGISPTAFADICGIPRPSMSQILNGRNKKINDVVVGAIHDKFPELSVVWLLFGEGDMLLSSFDDSDSSGMLTDGGSTDDSLFLGVSDFEEPAPYGNSNFIDPSPGIDNFNSQNLRQNPVNPYIPKDKNEYRKENGVKSPQISIQTADKELDECKQKITSLELQIENLRLNPRKVSQITVFYDDSTFESFVPERKNSKN